uniref:Uncharacterized protein n=1 Tax=Meloidogyne enterolobii TaxID=390850 RepID=A0A6V7V118_MELEN|nr:unnamed protein product [Meloidogyne enterolobii]
MLKIPHLPRPFIFCLLILFLSDSALACIGSAGFPGSSLFPQQYPADDAAGSYVAPPSEYKTAPPPTPPPPPPKSYYPVAPPPPSHYNYAPPTFTLQTLPPFTLPKLETLPPPPPLPQLFSYYPVAPPPPPPSYVLPQFQLQTLPPLQPFTLPPMPTFAPPPESYYPIKPPKYSTGPDQFSSLSSRREIPQYRPLHLEDQILLIFHHHPLPLLPLILKGHYRNRLYSQIMCPNHPIKILINKIYINLIYSLRVCHKQQILEAICHNILCLQEENQQQPAEPRNPNSAREQPPFETSNGFNDQNRQNEKQQKEKMKQERGRNVNNNVASSSGYSDDNLINTAVDNRQQQAEKPKVFGLSQQEVPHLEMEGGSDMNPIEMRNHLRSQLKSRKGRNDDTK